MGIFPSTLYKENFLSQNISGVERASHFDKGVNQDPGNTTFPCLGSSVQSLPSCSFLISVSLCTPRARSVQAGCTPACQGVGATKLDKFSYSPFTYMCLVCLVRQGDFLHCLSSEVSFVPVLLYVTQSNALLLAFVSFPTSLRKG